MFTDTEKTEILNAYCALAILGYPTDGEYEPTGESHYCKQFTVTDGRYMLTDRYWALTHELDNIAGETVLLHDYKPVMVIQYRGYYSLLAHDCLRSVLAETYRRGLFYGGRGAPVVPRGNYLYTNRVEGDWNRFSGREEIFHLSPAPATRLGYHEYNGIVLPQITEM